MLTRTSFLVLCLVIGWLPTVLAIRRSPPLIGDEAYYARVPVEMKQRNDWVVPYFNGQPRYKKPPLMYWLVSISFRLFGETETSARLPSLIATFLTALLLFWFGKQQNETLTGLLTATAFLLNPMTIILANSAIPEAMLNFFITASALMAFLGNQHPPSLGWMFLSALAMGLGILTKGAPAIMLPFLIIAPLIITSYKSQTLEREFQPSLKKSLAHWLIFIFTVFVVTAPWFIAVGFREGENFWQVFLAREHIQRITQPMEGHRGPIWFYLPVILLLFFPWSLRLPTAFQQALKRSSVDASDLEKWMVWWVSVVLVVFCLIATKLPHYIFPAVPAISWLSAKQWQRRANASELAIVILLAIFSVIIFSTFAFRLPEIYRIFLRKHQFAPYETELTALHAIKFSLLLGFMSSGALAIFATCLSQKLFDMSVHSITVSGAISAGIAFWVVWSALSLSGGHQAVMKWRQAPIVTTFGSDAEWTLFYSKRITPMFRSEKSLLKFLNLNPNASVLARIDYASVLKRCKLKLYRYGIWVIGMKE